MNNIFTLDEVLKSIHKLTDSHLLYLPINETWNSNTKCAVLSDEEDKSEHFAILNKLEPSLAVFEVQDIVSNLKLQVLNPTSGQLLEAFLFYFDNDAFKNSSKN